MPVTRVGMREQTYIGGGGGIGHFKPLPAVKLDVKVVLKVVVRGRPPARGADPHIKVFVVLGLFVSAIAL